MIERLATDDPHENTLIVDGELIVTMAQACHWFNVPYNVAWYKRYHKAESWETIFGLED